MKLFFTFLLLGVVAAKKTKSNKHFRGALQAKAGSCDNDVRRSISLSPGPIFF